MSVGQGERMPYIIHNEADGCIASTGPEGIGFPSERRGDEVFGDLHAVP